MDAFQLLLSSPTWSAPTAGGARLWRPLGAEGREADDVAATPPEERTGSWTLVEEEAGSLRVTTDRLRSHHLLLVFHEGRWLVSDDPDLLRRAGAPWARDVQQAELMRHTGFTVGTGSLLAGVASTPASSVVTLHADGRWEERQWASYRYETTPVTDPDLFGEGLTAALDTTVGGLVERAGSRQLVIPLSGGIDSRLLAVWLLRHGADRLSAFTYGRTASPEVEVSREVAERLGIEWFRVDLDPQAMARAWFGGEGEDFQRRTWGGTSLPHVQDWWALREMSRRGLVDADAVMLPGHTVVGNMHDEQLLAGPVGPAQVLSAVARHHSRLQGRAEVARSSPLLRREVLRAAAEVGLDPSRARSVQELVEWFNVRERQAKYINASVRAYEAFGFGWALPMLEAPLWQWLLSGSEELTATRAWYADFTSRAYARHTGTDPGYYVRPAVRMPSGAKRVLQAGMDVTGATHLLSRYRSVRTMLEHPMAFEAFSACLPRHEQVRRLAGGASSVGLWSDLFLDGRWGSSLVPEA